MCAQSALVTPEKVQSWANARGVRVSLRRTGKPTPSLAAAAAAFGLSPGRIARSVLILARNEPMIVVGPAAHGLKLHLIAGDLGIANNLVRIAPAPEALRLTGCPRGCMPPFGHTQSLRTMVDRGLLEHETVYALTTSPDVLMEVDPQDIVSATDALVGRFT